MNEVKAIIFDLDDTLYLEKQYIRSGFRRLSEWVADNERLKPLRESSRADIEWALNELYDAGYHRNTLDMWLIRNSLSLSLLPTLLEVYRQHTPKIEPASDVVAVLPQLAKQFRLGLVSDGREASQRLKWHSLGLEEWFSCVVFSDALGREFWKPSAQPYLMAAAGLAATPSACVYVGDNPEKDFLGARNAGMSSIRIRRPGGIHFSVAAVGQAAPNIEISSLYALSAFLPSFAGGPRRES